MLVVDQCGEEVQFLRSLDGVAFARLVVIPTTLRQISHKLVFGPEVQGNDALFIHVFRFHSVRRRSRRQIRFRDRNTISLRIFDRVIDIASPICRRQCKCFTTVPQYLRQIVTNLNLSIHNGTLNPGSQFYQRIILQRCVDNEIRTPHLPQRQAILIGIGVQQICHRAILKLSFRADRCSADAFVHIGVAVYATPASIYTQYARTIICTAIPAVRGRTLTYHTTGIGCTGGHSTVKTAVLHRAAAEPCHNAAHVVLSCCYYPTGNNEILHHATSTNIAEQALILRRVIDVQAGNGMAIAVKRTGKRFVIFPTHICANGCPQSRLTIGGRHILCVQRDVLCQLDILFVEGIAFVHQLGKIGQFHCIAKFIGHIRRTSALFFIPIIGSCIILAAIDDGSDLSIAESIVNAGFCDFFPLTITGFIKGIFARQLNAVRAGIDKGVVRIIYLDLYIRGRQKLLQHHQFFTGLQEFRVFRTRFPHLVALGQRGIQQAGYCTVRKFTIFFILAAFRATHIVITPNNGITRADTVSFAISIGIKIPTFFNSSVITASYAAHKQFIVNAVIRLDRSIESAVLHFAIRSSTNTTNTSIFCTLSRANCAHDDKITNDSVIVAHSKQSGASRRIWDIQPTDGMPGTVEYAIETIVAIADRCPFVPACRHIVCIQSDVTRQLKVFARIVCTRIDLLCQICQLCPVADLVGIRLRTSTTSKLSRNLAVPHVRTILGIQQSNLVLTVILVLGRLLVLVLLVLLILIGLFLALVILGGLVGVLAVALVRILVLVTGVSRLLFVLGVLALVIFALAVLAASGSTHVAAAAVPGVRRLLLLLLLAVVRHVTLGKRRGGHQRQREHYAHQQAHDTAGHFACPFLHVCSPLFVERIYIKTI